MRVKTKPKTKSELLAHYAQKKPKAFFQVDLSAGVPVTDNGDGIHMTIGQTTELMEGAHVRLLIATDPVTAVTLLRKAIAEIECRNSLVGAVLAGRLEDADDTLG
jgi:hypothetical protein